MHQRIDPDGLRLPIKLDSTGNEEFVPVPLAPVRHQAGRRVYAVEESMPRPHLANDRISRDRQDRLDAPDPDFLTCRPRTRREFLRLSGQAT